MAGITLTHAWGQLGKDHLGLLIHFQKGIWVYSCGFLNSMQHMWGQEQGFSFQLYPLQCGVQT